MTVHVPTTIAEAVGLLAEHPDAVLLAGGTDLMVEINSGHRRADRIVATDRIPQLRGWYRDCQMMRIGAGTTYATLEEPDAATVAPALAQAGRTVGSPQIRLSGTIGGNLATCSPAGDGLPVLAALEAEVTLRSAHGSRVMPVAEFMVGVKRTALQPGELIERISVPIVDGWQGYTKVGVRNAMVIAVASTALVVDRANLTVRIALGSVGPTVIRCQQSEAWVTERVDWTGELNPQLAREFGGRVAAESRPIDDHRSSAEYRRHAVRVMAERQLVRAWSSQSQGAPRG
jgi:CO/xanthine dehydrogenase FAD-binding subunit